jgi:hypothetical protein
LAENLDKADEMTAAVPDGATVDQCLRAWYDLMETCHQFVVAGLRREIGPDGDLKAAYRRWYQEQMEEHRRTLIHMMEGFARAESSHAP